MRVAIEVRRLLARFRHARLGSAAVEFAIVLPAAMLLYIGVAQVVDGVMTSRKVTNLTRTLVDLTSQQGTSPQLLSTPTPSNAVPAATLTNIMAAAQTLLTTSSTNSLTMTLSAIDVRNNLLGLCCVATVRWSYTQGGTLRPCNVQLQSSLLSWLLNLTTIPSGLIPTDLSLVSPISYIVADVSYTYQPKMTQSLVSFAPTMQRTEYMMPRTTGQVVTGPLPSSGTQRGVVCY